jgi:uncharacterized protein
MRSFPLFPIILFFLFFLLIATGSYQNFAQIFKNRKKHIPGWLFWIFHSFIFIAFIFLYIYPNQPKHATNIPVYFYYNALLITFLAFDLPMAFSFVLHRILERRTTLVPRAGLTLTLGIVVVMIYGIVLGKREVHLNELELHYPTLPSGFHDFSILQISDIHIGSIRKNDPMPKKVLRRIKQYQPDLLLLTGDLMNNFASEVEGFESLLKAMASETEAYSILGNHDYGDYTVWPSSKSKETNFEAIIEAHTKAGFTLLRNENAVIRQGNDSLFLVGVENWGHPPFPQYADLEKALEGIPSGAFTILMTHDPAHWESQVSGKKDIELTFAGHTHGLQWGLKPAGIPFSLAYFTRKYWGGLYRDSSSVLYVNTGLGTVGVPWRVDMPAEITLVTLKRGKID